jgi:hypothetical protein
VVEHENFRSDDYLVNMAHTIEEKTKASESRRGAMDAPMAEVIEGHIRFHILDTKHQAEEQARAADDLVEALRAYLR